MHSKKKNIPKRLTLGDFTIIIDDNMPDRSNDPFFVKKGLASEESMKKYGFPEEFLKDRQRRLGE